MHTLPRCEIRILNRRTAANAGIVEQHIEPAHIFMRGGQRLLPLGLARNIQPIGKALTGVKRINLVGHGLRAIGINIRHGDLGALFRQHERGGAPQPGGPSGYKSHFSGYPHISVSFSDTVISTDQKICGWRPCFPPIRRAGHIAHGP